MDIKDYIVVKGDDIESLVMQKVKEGYQPLGGIAIRHGSVRGAMFVQAMVSTNNAGECKFCLERSSKLVDNACVSCREMYDLP